MDQTVKNGSERTADERFDVRRLMAEAERLGVRFMTFGGYVEWAMTGFGLSENRLADLADVNVSVISRIISQDKQVSEGVALRILVALLGLSATQLDFINAGLALAGQDPHELGVPGRHKLPSHEEYERRRRGSVRGTRYGNVPTEAAKARRAG